MDETVKLDIKKDMITEGPYGNLIIDTGLTANELILFACGIDPKIDGNIIIPLTAKIQELREETRRAIDAQLNYAEGHRNMMKEISELREKNRTLELECDHRRGIMKGRRW